LNITLKDVLQLYLVTDRSFVNNGNSFETSIEQAIQGGVTIVQLREKELSSNEFYNLALRVKKITTKYNIPLIINDRLDVALAINADGVHVGQNDLPASVVRDILGPDKVLGISAATLQEARVAEINGADYIGVGAFFSTQTKSDTREVTLLQLKAIRQNVSIPIVAIGGINLLNASSVFENGADGIAVVSAILRGQNPYEAAIQLKEITSKYSGNKKKNGHDNK
jgi:thiamine-phosphate pyrophosphorylase